jgi:glycosyltransferase involved in cell wall biosynthesis
MQKHLNYVLITPARNEAEFIRLTIESVVGQSVRPRKWVVVSDGSTDGTDEIVMKYAAEHPWIEILSMPARRERHFAGKVHAFNAGYAKVQNLEYEVIACLDGDMSFDEDYFSFLLEKLASDDSLGLVGTPFIEGTSPLYDYRYMSLEHVSGACQLFRRECFEEIGGYVPVKGGCIDHIAVLSARMKGWKTRSFPEKLSRHHRPMGTAQHSMVAARLKNGAKDYTIGNHPIWECVRTVYQMTRPPLIIGGLMVGLGYAWSLIRHMERPVSRELIEFHRREQMTRLRAMFARRGRYEGSSSSAVLNTPE